MRSLSPLTLFVILMLTTLSPLAFSSALDDSQPTLKVGPRALIDFEVTEIEIGNGSLQAHEWTNPDGSVEEYVMRDELIQINVTFTQAGTSSQPSAATGKLQIWHPVGFMVREWQVNMTLSGFQSLRAVFYWTPNAAHSSLSEDGYLEGGIILKGIIDGGLADDNPDNDVYDRPVPVAVWDDPMDNGVCGDVDEDGTVDCPNQLSYGNPLWVGAGYDADGTLSDYPDYYGHWRMDNTSSAIGDRHWRASRAGSDYASNRHDRLWWGWLTPFDSCDDPGHGLGYGTLDSALSSVYANNFCLIRLRGFDYLSMQLVTNAWGEMGAGDQIRIEAASGSAEYYNYTAMALSTTYGDWSQLVWNMSEVHPTGEYTLSFLFESDSSYATQGIHLDGFTMFAIQRVPQYTLDVQCDDPLPNAYIVVPADSRPPSLHCSIHNNGYVDITLRLYTEVSNQSWMWENPLRIDSNHPSDHDNSVVTKVIKALHNMDAWFNLTIPDGVTVQEVDWYVHIGDGITNITKAEMTLPVDVTAAYSAYLTQKTLKNPAATLLPGTSGNITMTLKNTGNQVANWNLGATYGDNRWGPSNLRWFNETGVELTSIEMAIGDKVELNAELTAPAQITPGSYPITLLANGRAPANFQTEWTVQIEVPIDHALTLEPEVREMMAPADGALRWIEIRLINDGNAEEAFDLSLSADWRLGLSLNAEQTLGIDPFGGDTSILLMFPMPYGIENETYQIWVHAKSQLDPQYQRSIQLLLTVPETYLIEVPDQDLTEDVYRGGDAPRTMRWEVWNRGNMPDRFHISFETSHSDVTVFAKDLQGGRTAWIPAGSSWNLTVNYAFAADADGDRSVTLIATSQESESIEQSVSSSGTALFKVGRVGWLLVTPPTGTLVVHEKGTYEVIYTVQNLHPEDEQLMRADVDRSTEPDLFFNVLDVRVDRDDRDFVLAAGESRVIIVEVDVSQENLDNLAADSLFFNVILAVDSDIDKVSTPALIQLIKTEPIETGPDTSWWARLMANLVFFIGGLIAMGVVLVFTWRIVKDARAPIEEYSSLEDYTPSLSGFGEDIAIPAAPELPAADAIANSMYGGSQEIFENPADMPPPPLPIEPDAMPEPDRAPEPENEAESEVEDSQRWTETDSELEAESEAEVVPEVEEAAEPETVDETPEESVVEPIDQPVEVPAPEESALPDGVPPIPESGLPEGWTMEQWAYYGQKWIEQHKDD